MDKSWTLSILNLTPWEGSLELSALGLGTDAAFPNTRSLSVSEDVDITRYTERMLGTHLLKARLLDRLLLEPCCLAFSLGA
jgi:hypothetical protein